MEIGRAMSPFFILNQIKWQGVLLILSSVKMFFWFSEEDLYQLQVTYTYYSTPRR